MFTVHYVGVQWIELELVWLHKLSMQCTVSAAAVQVGLFAHRSHRSQTFSSSSF